MHPLLEELKSYHQHLSVILSQLRKTLNDLDKTPDSEKFRQQLFSILGCFYNSNEAYHHANEELVCTQLVLSAPSHHQGIAQIKNDHKKFDKLLNRIRKFHINEIYNNTLSSDFIDAIKEFMELSNTHTITEDTLLLPLAEKWISPQQWHVVEHQWHPLPSFHIEKLDGDKPSTQRSSQKQPLYHRHP